MKYNSSTNRINIFTKLSVLYNVSQNMNYHATTLFWSFYQKYCWGPSTTSGYFLIKYARKKELTQIQIWTAELSGEWADEQTGRKYWATHLFIRMFARTAHSFACSTLLALLTREESEWLDVFYWPGFVPQCHGSSRITSDKHIISPQKSEVRWGGWWRGGCGGQKKRSEKEWIK